MVLLGVFSVLAVIPVAIYQILGGRNQTITQILLQCASLISVTLSVFLARRWLDRRSISSLGIKITRKTIQDILGGVCLSAVMVEMIYLVERLAGWLQPLGFAWQSIPWETLITEILSWLAIFCIVAWSEELFSRGYQFHNLLEGVKPAWAIAFSSMFWSLGHLFNPSAGWAAVLGIYTAGIFLAFCTLRTGQLWLAMGWHLGWNFFEGVVFGFPVSGIETIHLLQNNVKGPLIMTGGNFGPEAGLILLPILALGAICVAWYTRKKAPPGI